MKRLELVAGLVVGLVATLAIDLFGVLGLIVVTVLLIVSIAMRAPALVLACAISCGAILVLWALAIQRCTPTASHSCAIEGPLLVMFSWLAAVLVIGLAATWTLRSRSRPPNRRTPANGSG